MATAPQLEAEFQRVGALEGVELAVVDLRELAFLDPSGLEAIVKFESRSRAAAWRSCWCAARARSSACSP